jgi:BolA family transcriptional regulator, general stress-responsive regulator
MASIYRSISKKIQRSAGETSKMTIEDCLRARLATLSPTTVLFSDDSAAHVGHAGAGDGGHYSVTIVSQVFEGQSLLARHRAVMRCVSDLIPTPIHALSVRALIPDEFN